MKRSAIGFILAPLLALAGCRPAVREPYYGPTLALSDLVQKINQNNDRLPTLWSRIDVQATIYDEQQNRTDFAGSGHLLYRANGDLRIEADNEFNFGFELGSTPALYWMKVNAPRVDRLWWGHVSNLGKPCSQAIPIQPRLLADVLAIGSLDSNLLDEPAPVMHFQNNDDAYVVDWVVTGANRLLLQREVWYDRQSLQPRLVVLFDGNGRPILGAKLMAFGHVAVPDVKPGQQPLVATHYDLFFPDTRSTLTLTLRDQELTHNGVPRPGSIHLNLANPGVKTVTQIDEDCNP